MKPSPATLGGIALALLLTLGTAGRADPIAWTYSWSNTPDVLYANKPGTGTITLSDESKQTAAGDSDVVATNIQVHSTATVSHPDAFTRQTYTLGLTLTDQASGQTGTLNFTGFLDGTATASSARITNTFTGPVSQPLFLGNNRYTVTMTSYTPPGPPGAANSGSIGAHAVITVEALPEPGAGVLAGCGACLLGLAAWRYRRSAPWLA
jgi:hypothetical protein